MRTLIKKTGTILFLSLFILIQQSFGQTYAKNGMVACSSESSSEVGVEILKKGGNAIDAAVATAFSLAVTWPTAGNLGGGGFIVFMNNEGNVTTIDFREKAPLAATSDMYLDENGELIQNLNHLSIKAVGVPGTVAGLYKAHQQYGKLSWEEVMQPAINQAENGIEFTWSLYAHSLRDWSKYPEMDRYFRMEDGSDPEPGDIWKQKNLANTLKQIRDGGPQAFYKGEIAKTIADYMKKEGGLITKKDLKEYEAIERKPIKGSYKGYDIYSMPPPSSGGITLIQMLNMMENYDFDKIEFNSAEYLHVMIEVMRRAYSNRAEHLGDPDFNPDMPVDQLLSKDYARSMVDLLDMSKASVSDSSKFSQIYDGESTTHLSVLDKDGNAVSLTYTLEYGYGSRRVVKELGFILNNEMGDFNPVPGYTNSKGIIGTVPNQIVPGKRMLSSMTPSIVSKEGRPYLVIGSPGGRTIINSVFQAIFNVLEHDMSVDKSIEALKIHHQWLPDVARYEKYKLSPDTRKTLTEMGHVLKEYNRWGALMGIQYDAEKDILIGASDSSRPDGAAVGY